MKLKQKCLVDGCYSHAGRVQPYCRNHRNRDPNRRYKHVILYAKKRNIPVKLSYQHFLLLLASNMCYYCKGPLNGTGGGLDRLDSSKGYTKSNVVTCCLECNTIKSNLVTDTEMLEIIKLLKRLRKTNRIWSKKNPQKRRKKNGISRSKKR